jgi:hypothetical protein
VRVHGGLVIQALTVRTGVAGAVDRGLAGRMAVEVAAGHVVVGVAPVRVPRVGAAGVHVGVAVLVGQGVRVVVLRRPGGPPPAEERERPVDQEPEQREERYRPEQRRLEVVHATTAAG